MAMAPSLVDICCMKVAAQDFHKHAQALEILPLDLLNRLILKLTPLSLHYLQQESTRLLKCKYEELDVAFPSAWENLLKHHHTSYTSLSNSLNWEQLYWEAHIQNCLDAVTTAVSVPRFTGRLADLSLPEELVHTIGSQGSDCTSLGTTLPLLGRYVKSLRVRGVLCSEELLILLNGAELESLSCHNFKTSSNFHTLFKFLGHNRRSLKRLEFFYCKFLEDDFDSLLATLTASGLNHFAVNCSSIQVTTASPRLREFLRNTRHLESIQLVSDRMHMQFTSSLVVELFSLTSLSSLELCDNLLENCFESTKVEQFFRDCSARQQLALHRLKVLNVKSCFLSSACVQSIVNYLRCLPYLQTLNLSDNPLGDEGIEALTEWLKGGMSSLEELNFGGCELSCRGISSLLGSLICSKQALNFLSIADNNLGRTGSAILAKYLEKADVKSLDIAEIGLGSLGCSTALTSALVHNHKLVHLNISKNRIGLAGAKLLHAVIAGNGGVLTSIDASFNLFNMEAMRFLFTALELNATSSRKMKRLDLQGNPGCHPEVVRWFASFVAGSEPVVLLSRSHHAPLHDDDP